MSGTLNERPLEAEEFDSLLGSLPSPTAKVAIAVSGGADSMALAFCVHRWVQSNKGTCIAFIVDHALRTESAAEAIEVKARLEKLGIPTEILHWEHLAITSKVHERARRARYALLIEACHRHSAASLMVAHHREDQAETILMRIAKGSGVEGLAGMTSQSWRGDILLLRPFLNLPKERLLATCRAADITYITDPSNLSDKYARGRLRKVMPLLEKEGLTTETLLDLGARAAEAREAIDYYTLTFLHQAAVCEIGGSIHLDRPRLALLPRAIALRALSSCLRYVHDDGYAPERSALISLLEAVNNDQNGRTLYGCLISITEKTLLILREPAAAIERLPFHPGNHLLWDNRWIVSGTVSGAPDLTLRALGNPPHEVIDRLSPRLRHTIPQGRIRATLPALWKGDDLHAIPSFEDTAPFRLAFRKQGFP